MEYEIQTSCQRIRSISKNIGSALPELVSKAQANSAEVEYAEADTDQRLIEMGKKLHTITKNRGAPLREEDDKMSLGTSSMFLECITVELEELQVINENLTLDVLELQERISSPIMISTPEHAKTRKESNPGGNKAQERDIVKKGMERLEKEIAQYTQIQLSTEQVDISLLKRCKLTDIPAVNLAIKNI